MKRILAVVLAVLFATLFIPLIIVSLLSGTNDVPPETVSVYIKSEDRVEDMDISEYLKRVVSAEMPADFEPEALKAQAVAARTYLISRMNAAADGNSAEEHKGADVCTDSAHCQAYITEEARRETWTEKGIDADEAWEKISDAVTDTDNLIMTYGGEPVSAVFHSASSGKTERAADVWGEDIPYLQSVESEGDLYSPKYASEVRMSAEDFKKIAESNIEGVSWENGFFGNIVRSGAGGIVTLDVGGVNIKGTELRRIYDLNSTNVELTETDGNIKMNVKGFGHGVGMSQYGADYMAKQGKKFDEILKSYYTGVKLEKR